MLRSNNSFDFTTRTWNNRCLSFWRMSHSGLDPDRNVVFSYWLEGQSIHVSGIPNRKPITIELHNNQLLRNLDDRAQLESWEPMTPKKMTLIGLQLGVLGDDSTIPWAPDEMYLSEVVVSPQGFVFVRDVVKTVSVSDVRTLTNAPGDPFSLSEADEEDFWQNYWISTATGKVGTRPDEPRPAQVGNGVLPQVTNDALLQLGSLATFGEKVMDTIADSGNDPLDIFSGESATFVQHYLGFNPADMDLRSANMARAINAAYANPAEPTDAVPFNPHKALDALQKAATATAVSRTRAQTRSASPVAGWTRGQPGSPQSVTDRPGR